MERKDFLEKCEKISPAPWRGKGSSRHLQILPCHYLRRMLGTPGCLMAGAFTVRLLLSRLTEFPETVENRIELANSQVGIKAVREAAYLLKHAVPIYENGCSCQPVREPLWMLRA